MVLELNSSYILMYITASSNGSPMNLMNSPVAGVYGGAAGWSCYLVGGALPAASACFWKCLCAKCGALDKEPCAGCEAAALALSL